MNVTFWIKLDLEFMFKAYHTPDVSPHHIGTLYNYLIMRITFFRLSLDSL